MLNDTSYVQIVEPQSPYTPRTPPTGGCLSPPLCWMTGGNPTQRDLNERLISYLMATAPDVPGGALKHVFVSAIESLTCGLSPSARAYPPTYWERQYDAALKFVGDQHKRRLAESHLVREEPHLTRPFVMGQVEALLPTLDTDSLRFGKNGVLVPAEVGWLAYKVYMLALGRVGRPGSSFGLPGSLFTSSAWDRDFHKNTGRTLTTAKRAPLLRTLVALRLLELTDGSQPAARGRPGPGKATPYRLGPDFLWIPSGLYSGYDAFPPVPGETSEETLHRLCFTPLDLPALLGR